MLKCNIKLGVVVILLFVLLGHGTLCAVGRNNNELILATTTSVENSGLLNVLLPIFEKQTGMKVKVLAVGTGQALRLAGEGNADLVITHHKQSEEEFVLSGKGVKRIPFMRNRFIIAGPRNDPAALKDVSTAVIAFQKIAKSTSLFISRGDKSGTYQKELELWQKAEVKPQDSRNYIETGAGMEATLFMANEKQAYTLTDEGTFESIAAKISLERLYAGDQALDNIYSIIAVNSNMHKEINAAGARQLITFFTQNPETRSLIETFKRTRDGRPLFYVI